MLRTSPQPAIPLPAHLVVEGVERAGVSGNAVIPVVPPELPPQLVCLCLHLVMPMKSAPLGYRLHTPRQTVLRRSPFHYPSALAALPPVMGEPQEVECPWSNARSAPEGWRPESEHPRFVMMKIQPVFPTPLGQDLHDSGGIVLSLAYDDTVIRVSHKKRLPAKSGERLLGEPYIQHVMEIHVRKDGRNIPTLWTALGYG